MAIVPGVGFGLAAAFAHLGLVVPMIVAVALPLIILVAARPRVFSLSNSGYESPESRSDDVPTWRHWTPFLWPAVTFLVGYALDPLPVDPAAGGVAYGAAAVLVFTWSFRRMGEQYRRVGHRRARKILEPPPASRSSPWRVSTPPRPTAGS